MAGKKVNIDITTTANTAGAKEAAKSIEAVEKQSVKAELQAERNAAKEAARVARENSNAEKAAAAEKRRVDRAVATKEAASRRKEEATQREQRAVERLRAAEEKQAAASIAASQKAEARQAAAASKATGGKGSYRAGQIGIQAQDIAVQAQMGTQASTILAQQGSQILSIFGPGGQVAGAMIAFGAIAVQTYLNMGESAEQAKAKADELTASIKSGIDLYVKTLSEEYDFGKANIEDAITAGQAYAKVFQMVPDAVRSAYTAALQTSKDLIKIELDLRRARGETIDQIKEAQILGTADAKIRADALAQQIKAEQDRVRLAEEEAVIAKAAAIDAENRKITMEAQRTELAAQLEILKQQQKTLEGIAKKGTEAARAQDMATPYDTPGSFQAAAKKEAAQALGGGQFTVDIPRIEAELKFLNKELDGLTGEVSLSATRTAQALALANTTLQQTTAAAEIKIGSINENAQLTEATAGLAQIEQTQTIAADKVKVLIEGIVPATVAQQAALDQLRQATSNSRITLDETAATSQSLSTLSGVLNSSTQANTQQVVQLIAIMNTFQAQLRNTQTQIDSLRSRSTTPRPIN